MRMKGWKRGRVHWKEGCKDGWKDRVMEGRTEVQKDRMKEGQMGGWKEDEWKDGRREGHTEVRKERGTDIWIEGRTDGGMDGQTDRWND